MILHQHIQVHGGGVHLTHLRQDIAGLHAGIQRRASGEDLHYRHQAGVLVLLDQHADAHIGAGGLLLHLLPLLFGVVGGIDVSQGGHIALVDMFFLKLRIQPVAKDIIPVDISLDPAQLPPDLIPVMLPVGRLTGGLLRFLLHLAVKQQDPARKQNTEKQYRGQCADQDACHESPFFFPIQFIILPVYGLT